MTYFFGHQHFTYVNDALNSSSYIDHSFLFRGFFALVSNHVFIIDSMRGVCEYFATALTQCYQGWRCPLLKSNEITEKYFVKLKKKLY